MLRRACLMLLAFAFSAAVQPTKVYRIGYLTIGTGERPPALLDELKRLGYADGRNLRMEWRRTAGDIQRLEKFARELADLKPDLAASASSFCTSSLPRLLELRTAAQTKQALHAVLEAKPGALVALDDQVIAGQSGELVINMKTARALGVAVPRSLLLRANKVIE